MKFYKIKAFSRLTGLSVRSLQYYDAIGLLKPSHKNDKGYRHYSDVDFIRLQHIFALKLRGLSLKAIHDYMQRSPLDQSATLALLDDELKQRLNTIAQAQCLIGQSRHRVANGESLDGDLLGRILQLVQSEALQGN